MYECRCPNDGKKLAEIARPPLSELRYLYHCVCGRKVEGKVLVEEKENLILGLAKCACGREETKILGYLVTIRCKRCKEIVKF